MSRKNLKTGKWNMPTKKKRKKLKRIKSRIDIRTRKIKLTKEMGMEVNYKKTKRKRNG